jgi:sporulation protein YlmC with PRC-barrel domain
MFICGTGGGIDVTNGRRLMTEEERVASEDRLRELEDKYEDYKVYDNQGQKIGKVDDLFVDETDREEYIGVKMGFFGMKSTLIPMDIVRVNENDRSVEVSEAKDHVKNAPSFDDDEDITPDYEDRIRSHFGLESLGASSGYEARPGTGGYEDRESHDYGTTEYEDSGERETSELASSTGGTAPAEATREYPTSRQTEESETFQEGGRTKIRRRIIREEIIEEDDPNDRA